MSKAAQLYRAIKQHEAEIQSHRDAIKEKSDELVSVLLPDVKLGDTVEVMNGKRRCAMKIERFGLETHLFDKNAFAVIAYGRAVLTSTGEVGVKRMTKDYQFKIDKLGEA